MKLASDNVVIIGAGVSGLVAAMVLEQHGLKPIFYEQSSEIGGRLKTDVIDGEAIDHGFQVLLTAYPLAKKYLNYVDLDLLEFKPGALLFGEKNSRFGDPRRDLSFAWSTLVSSLATLNDKLKIYQLSRKLKAQSIQDIFNGKNISTFDYLKNFGFSEHVIHHFFMPFYGGIFLENKLYTNSKMFRFIFKMFSEGIAAVPKKGIAAIPEQLMSNLNQSEFNFNTKVKAVQNQQIILESGEVLESEATIIATEAESLISNLNDSKMEWKSCKCFYYEAEENTMKEQIIGLNYQQVGLVNNFHFLSPESKVISITITHETDLPLEQLKGLIEKEMHELCGINLKRFIKHFEIAKALPDIENVNDNLEASEPQLLDHVFLAGDVMLNGSLNAAMLAGEKAAEAVLMKKGLIKTIA